MGMVFLMRLLAGSGFTWLLFWLPLGRRAPPRCCYATTKIHRPKGLCLGLCVQRHNPLLLLLLLLLLLGVDIRACTAQVALWWLPQCCLMPVASTLHAEGLSPGVMAVGRPCQTARHGLGSLCHTHAAWPLGWSLWHWSSLPHSPEAAEACMN